MDGHDAFWFGFVAGIVWSLVVLFLLQAQIRGRRRGPTDE